VCLEKGEGPMATKRYVVTLTDEERTPIVALTKKGRVALMPI
jgi:hypothetical protein